jgi:hypothetical protein
MGVLLGKVGQCRLPGPEALCPMLPFCQGGQVPWIKRSWYEKGPTAWFSLMPGVHCAISVGQG